MPKANSLGERMLALLLTACLALPLVLAWVAHARGHAPRELAETPARPGLAFDQYMVDLREVPPSETVFARFGFRNTGTQPVHISTLVPSCGCLQPRLSKKTYAPGEDGEFLLRVLTANQDPGQKDYRVVCRYEDPQPREQELIFRVKLPANQVFVRPRALAFYQQASAEPTVQELTVTDLRSNPLEVQGASCDSPLVSFEVLPAETVENGARNQRIRITVQGNVPPGRHRTVVKCFTSDSTYHELQVPLWIEGPSTATAARSAAKRQ